jgi:tetratricopeptide (TPR) repeat protein
MSILLQGDQYYQNQNYYEAIKCYTIILNTSETLEIYQKRAKSYIKLGKYNEAKKDCKIMIKKDKNFVKGYMLLSYCYIQFGQFKSALDWYNIFPDQNNIEIQNKKQHVLNINNVYHNIIKNRSELHKIKLNLKKILKYVSESLELHIIYNDLLIYEKKYKTALSILLILFKKIINKLNLKIMIKKLHDKYPNNILEQMIDEINFTELFYCYTTKSFQDIHTLYKTNKLYNNAYKIYKKVLTYKSNKHYNSALKGLDDILTINLPDKEFKTFIYTLKSSIYICMKNYKGALDIINKTLQITPNNSSLYSNKANVLLKLNQYDEVPEILNQAIKLDSKNKINIYKNYVKYYQYKGSYQDILKNLNKILLLNPSDNKIIKKIDLLKTLIKGKNYLNNNNNKSALKCFNKTLKITTPFNNNLKSHIYIDKVIALMNMNNYKHIESNLNRAYQLNPNNVRIYEANALYNYKKKFYKKALENLNKILPLIDKNKKFYGNFKNKIQSQINKINQEILTPKPKDDSYEDAVRLFEKCKKKHKKIRSLYGSSYEEKSPSRKKQYYSSKEERLEDLKEKRMIYDNACNLFNKGKYLHAMQDFYRAIQSPDDNISLKSQEYYNKSIKLWELDVKKQLKLKKTKKHISDEDSDIID